MDHGELGDMGSGCENENCSLAPESCSNQECQSEEPVFGLIELVCMTIIYILLMIFGLLGNILTILVVWLRPHMRSCTYLYLSSMAVSDILILLLLPLDLYKLWRPRPWPLGDLACKLTMFLSECCTFCTILHITFLSLERYLVVCWPFTAKTLVTQRRTRTIIGCLWLGAAVSAAPVLVMVGVEEVGGEDPGLSGWRERGGWTNREGEQGFIMVGRERRSGHETLGDGGQEGVNKWDDRVREFEGEQGRRLGMEERDERKQGDEDTVSQEGATIKVDRANQNKMKEDKGEEGEKIVDGGHRVDTRECRCTHYASSSGLLSAMMILSNMYFLVPLCILGLVYSLIGRTLWLRSHNNRRDQSQRHTIRMLGVIVLAFVLCWLPFHVGRTILTLSDGQETNVDTSSHLHTLSDVSTDRNINVHSLEETASRTDSDPIFETRSETGKLAATEIVTHADMGKQSDDKSRDKHFNSLVAAVTTEQHINSDFSRHNPNISYHTVTNTSKQTNRSCYTDVLAHASVQKCATICINSEITPNHTPPTASINTYAATPTDLYNTENDFNSTGTNPDNQPYFLYYLSQYFNLVSSVLYYLSAALNPLLYNVVSTRYRHAVRSIVRTHSHAQSHRQHTLSLAANTSV